MTRWLPLLAGLVACSGPGADPARAARLANAIAASPEQAPALLQAEGLDRAQFDAWLFAIAADPDKTREYLQALEASSQNPYAPPR